MELSALDVAHAQIDRIRKDGKLLATDGKDGRQEMIIKHIERSEGHGSRQVHEDVQIRLADGALGADLAARLAPIIAGTAGDLKWSGKASSKDLGARDFDGVKADGKLRSYEIPAGALGNKNPMTVSDESWYAPHLQITVYSKHSDPRSGEATYRLASLKRAEPGPALFAIPGDYTVKDIAAQVQTLMIEKHAPAPK
jgi:hypothetical protein